MRTTDLITANVPNVNSVAAHAGKRRAFTLIELLMVIGIIGILAALLIGSATYAARTMRIKRVSAELNQLVLQIEAYKAKLGFYPPDKPGDPSGSPLFYELVGTYQNGGSFFTTDDPVAINIATLGVAGFANATTEASSVKSFVTKLNPKQLLPAGSNPQFWVVPVTGVNGTPNYWNYNSSSPTNNPRTFDLWAVVVIGGKTNVIGNWKN